MMAETSLVGRPFLKVNCDVPVKQSGVLADKFVTSVFLQFYIFLLMSNGTRLL